MVIESTHILAALAGAAASAALLVVRNRRRNEASERRMMQMIERVGVPSAIASINEPRDVWESVAQTCLVDARYRCRSCRTVDACEVWLATDRKDGNDFCPNAKLFDALKVMCKEISTRPDRGR